MTNRAYIRRSWGRGAVVSRTNCGFHQWIQTDEVIAFVHGPMERPPPPDWSRLGEKRSGGELEEPLQNLKLRPNKRLNNATD